MTFKLRERAYTHLIMAHHVSSNGSFSKHLCVANILRGLKVGFEYSREERLLLDLATEFPRFGKKPVGERRL